MSQQPPSTIVIQWCDRCGRTNRHRSLRAKHYYEGSTCSGQLFDVIYQNSGVVR